MHDLVIRGAMVIDGLGRDLLRADIAIAGGRIAAIGDVGKDAAQVLDECSSRSFLYDDNTHSI